MDNAASEPMPEKSVPAQRTVSDAVGRFLKSRGDIGPDGSYRGDVEYGTFRKYRNSLGLMVSILESTMGSCAVRGDAGCCSKIFIGRGASVR